MEKSAAIGLSHLLATVFLYYFANFIVVPSITDVTMAAICPGKDECSLAIYLTGAQNVIIGLGSMVAMPLVGNLSDTYGRKVMLTLPISLSIFPLLIIAYNRTRYYFYIYYVLRTLIAMATEGSVHFLALAYVADTVPESRRAAVFGIMSGLVSSSFVFGNFSGRFLSTSAAFQVAAAMSVISLLYMKLFLPESIPDRSICASSTETDCLLEKNSTKNLSLFRTLDDAIYLLRTSHTFTKAAVVALFVNAGEVGLNASLLYYLKAQFHFNKDQFADFMIIGGTAGSISQLILMPILTPFMGEEVMLTLGLFFMAAHMILYSVAWAPWVPYAAAMINAFASFAMPCLRSIASKLVGPSEQGKVQGSLVGISSLANIVCPLVFSPLTALFLSDNAPFHFPGFGIMCAGLAAMIAFVQSTMIRHPRNCNTIEPLV